MNKIVIQFSIYASEGKNMDAMEALHLLTKAYIKECGKSLGMRTALYNAAEIWLYERLPKQNNNPFTAEQMEQPLVDLMPLICDEYKPDYHGQWDIWTFDAKELRRFCLLAIKGEWYDKPTLQALCYGIKVWPKTIEKWADEEAAKIFAKE